MWVQGRVLDSSGSPIRGAVVEIWQADNNGAYLHTASPVTNREPNFQGYGSGSLPVLCGGTRLTER